MAHLYDTRYDMSDREILSSIHIWHMVRRGRTRAGPLYLWCVDIICWEILPFIILFVSIRNLFSCRISHCLLWYRDSWYWGQYTSIYRDIVHINTTVISIKIQIEKGKPNYHLRCVDKSEDTILALIESINRNLKSAFGVILHCTVAQTGNGLLWFKTVGLQHLKDH